MYMCVCVCKYRVYIYICIGLTRRIRGRNGRAGNLSLDTLSPQATADTAHRSHR